MKFTIRDWNLLGLHTTLFRNSYNSFFCSYIEHNLYFNMSLLHVIAFILYTFIVLFLLEREAACKRQLLCKVGTTRITTVLAFIPHESAVIHIQLLQNE